MQNESIGNNYSSPTEPLSEPHFDEEATLLSARPVVPLAIVKAKRSNRRRFLFAGTIAASVLVGMLGGMLIYSQRMQDSSASNSTVKEVTEAPATKEQDNETVANANFQDSEVAEERNEVPVTPPTVTSEEKRAKPLKKTKTGGEGPKAKLVGVIRGTTPELKRQHEPDSREAQRPRRVKDRGDSSRDEPDDMFRISEIFEGPRP